MITVTGATGQLGRLTIAALLQRGVPAAEIVAGVRNVERGAELAALGVQVRHADYDRPETLAEAFAGSDRLLLISGSEVGKRVAQHANAVAAAKAAGVRLLAYTSILNADTSGVGLAEEHRATEALVRDSGLPFVLLRNGWYLENYTANLAPALQHGAILGSANDGRVAAATRADYAAAAAAVLTGDGHDNKVYELGGDQPFTMAELAAEVTRQSSVTVVYRDLPPAEYAAALAAAGLPEPVAAMLADSDQGVARGELNTDRRDLRTLIGRPTTTLGEAIGAALPA
ncbi:NAD(P)H dehydrogenase (quinone) [Micromonospora pattaloongensis]|uniref:NAD(P)H dehydrogenase (Quinone) n=1 Tax=Micromonospora pattaloongensis TaxID=405436 RepID=A0A1H3P0R1_9ACTN|nr:SDR family oxidoreductase [Micromonospora pattaloongensis]SDY94641.1 NAD(P)H dehydrogenase (quinone) [Micromonospora pattaloongensis]